MKFQAKEDRFLEEGWFWSGKGRIQQKSDFYENSSISFAKSLQICVRNVIINISTLKRIMLH